MRWEDEMSNQYGEESRDAAEGFGDSMEDAAGSIGEGINSLQGENEPEQNPPDGGGGDITINIDN
jgi:hypothetical protein